MFPDDVETITMTRQDYDRNMENLIYENIDLKQRIDKAIEYIEAHKKTINKEQTKGTRLQIGTFMWNIDKLLDILKGSDSNDR